MNATRQHRRLPPAIRSNAVNSTAARSAWWVLGAPALALAATLLLTFAGAPGDWTGAVSLVAVLWMIAASLVQALWAGLRYGDWSAFSCADLPCATPPRDDDHDWATRSGRYAYRRIRDEHEALMREGDRYLEDRDHADSLG